MKGKGTKEGYNDDYVDMILQSIFMGWSTFFSFLFFFFFFFCVVGNCLMRNHMSRLRFCNRTCKDEKMEYTGNFRYFFRRRVHSREL